MIDLEQPNILRLFNVDEDIRDALKTSVIRIQPHLEQIRWDISGHYVSVLPTLVWNHFSCSDTNDYSEFRWKNPIWNHAHDAHEPIEALLIKEALTMATIGKILMTMNKHELNLFGTSRLASNTQKRCQLIFRQSNVNYSRCLCLHLSGTGTFKKETCF